MPFTFPPIGNDVLSYMRNIPSGNSIFLQLLDDAGSFNLIDDSNSPVTVFAPSDSAWDLQADEQDLLRIVQNHIFNRLWFLDDLAKMDGETIQSINGKEWTVNNVDGMIMLSSDSTVPVGVVAENLLRNGILHYLQDGILVDQGVQQIPTSASTLQPNPQNQTLEPVQSPSELSQNCSACDGSINPWGSLPDGLSCVLWQRDVSQLEANSEQCFIERALGVEYCGCPRSEIAESCKLCPGTSLDASKMLPDARGLNCSSLAGGALVSVDAPTCGILAEKYSSWCGCPYSTEPTCSFCPSGNIQDRPFIVPALKSLSFDNTVFGHITNTSCRGISEFYSVQTEGSCDSVGDLLAVDVPYGLESWCGCSNTEAPKICGQFCSTGSTLQESYVFDRELGLTCKEVSEIFDYVADKKVCVEAEGVKELCCVPKVVVVNASFVVSNQQGFTADDLVSPEISNTLYRALTDFAINLVAETEGKQRALRGIPWARRLKAILQQNSTDIVAVETVDCPSDVPANSDCQNVFGRFNLTAQGETPKKISDRYAFAVPSAIEGGKLQKSLDTTDPNSPFRVEGVAVTDDANKDSGSGKMSWWLILLIVIASVSGCFGILCLVVFVNAKQRTRPAADEAEASVQLLPKERQERQEMAPIDVDESSWTEEDDKVEPHWIQTNEENRGWDSPESIAVVEGFSHHGSDDDYVVEQADEKATPDMEKARPMPVEIDDAGSDSWARAEQDGEWDDHYGSDDDDDEWEGSDEEGDANGDNDPVESHDDENQLDETRVDGQAHSQDPPDSHKVDPPEQEPDNGQGEMVSYDELNDERRFDDQQGDALDCDNDEVETAHHELYDERGVEDQQSGSLADHDDDGALPAAAHVAVIGATEGDGKADQEVDETPESPLAATEEGDGDKKNDKLDDEDNRQEETAATSSSAEEAEDGSVPWVSVSDAVAIHEPSRHEGNDNEDKEEQEEDLPWEPAGNEQFNDEPIGYLSDDTTDPEEGIVRLQGELADVDSLVHNDPDELERRLYEEPAMLDRDEYEDAMAEEWDNEDMID
jgi:Fasciclin domain